jgi:CRP-like cAMP-binding protein
MRCWPFTLSIIWLSWDKIDGLSRITPPMFDTAFVLLVVVGLCPAACRLSETAGVEQHPPRSRGQAVATSLYNAERAGRPCRRPWRRCLFYSVGAVEVRLPVRHMRLGTGEFLGEMAFLTGRPRQADVVALSYCRLWCCSRGRLRSLRHGESRCRSRHQPCCPSAACDESG